MPKKKKNEVKPSWEFDHDRDKSYHAEKQNPKADLAGKSYLPHSQLFKNCDEEQIEWMLKGIRDDDRRKRANEKLRKKRFPT